MINMYISHVPELLRGQVPRKPFDFCLLEMKDKIKEEEKW